MTGVFPGGPVVKNPRCSGGDSGLIPGWGTKIPPAAEQLGPQATVKIRHSQKLMNKYILYCILEICEK